MSDTDLTIHTSGNGARPATEPVPSNRRTVRVRRASAVVGVAALALLPAMAGCSGDDADPSMPDSSLPQVGSVPAAPDGAGVPLEPGSNLPIGEDGGDRGGENDMDVDGDGIGESDGENDSDG